MGRAVIMLALLLSVASCGLFGGFGNASKRAETENTLPFKAKLSKGEGRAYSVAVVHKGSGVAELRESVRFEATKYCLLTFGRRQIYRPFCRAPLARLWRFGNTRGGFGPRIRF